MRIFITGTAGFIGFHLARRLLADGHEVLGYDGFTDYYDVALKRARHAMLAVVPGFGAVEGMLENADLLSATIAGFRPERVVHLAAQAGVRYSLEQPRAYVSANIDGTLNLLEALRQIPPAHLLFASTSSVYGAGTGAPFVETDATDSPLSIYAATKRGAESMTHAYAHLFRIPTTVARFFTVYGPWGRPDMAAFRFARAMERGEPIELYGEGKTSRDLTFIDDAVHTVSKLLDLSPQTSLGTMDTLSPVGPWRVVNVGGGRPVGLLDFVDGLERALEMRAVRRLVPMQPGDATATRADDALQRALIGYVPATSLDVGLKAFADWYRTDGRQFRS